MLRDVFFNRAILAGTVFFLLLIVGAQLYSWHVRRTTDAELQWTDRAVQALENRTQTRTAANTVETSRVNFEQAGAPLENQYAQPRDDDPAALPSDDAAPIDLSDAFLPDDSVSKEEQFSEEIPVSPYGFGPYPEVPAGYPLPLSIPWEWSEETIASLEKTMENPLQEKGVSFTEFLKTNELMARVGIKLWNEGRHFDGITTSDQTGRFYPNEPDVLYVKWREATLSNGEVRRYMSRTIGSAISSVSIAAQEGRETPPDWLEIRSLDDGIAPYEFLGLNR